MAPAAITTVVAAISAMITIPVATVMTTVVRTSAVVPANYDGRRCIDNGRRRIDDRARRVIHRWRRGRVDGISRHPDADTHRHVRLRGAHKTHAERGGRQNLHYLVHFYSPRRGPVHTTGHRNDMHSMS